MKRVTLIVRQTEINRVFPSGFQLLLEDNASTIDVIRVADEEIKKKCGQFPVKECRNLLHMGHHSHENRFSEQVVIQAHSGSKQFLNIRKNPKTPLPNGTTVILIPQGGCQTDWEEPIR